MFRARHQQVSYLCAYESRIRLLYPSVMSTVTGQLTFALHLQVKSFGHKTFQRSMTHCHL